MAGLLVLVPYEQTHRALSTLKKVGALSPDGREGSPKCTESHRQKPKCCKGFTDRDGAGGWA